MAKNRIIELENGVLTSPMDVNTKEFKEFQLFLSKKAASLTKKQKLQIELFALQIKLEEYLKSEEDTILTVGDFLRLYIDKLNLKQNKLANYIGLNPSNFSKLLSGSRKINFELSFKLSQIFELDPKTWMLIQVKNDYLELKKNRVAGLQNFSLEDLINA